MNELVKLVQVTTHPATQSRVSSSNSAQAAERDPFLDTSFATFARISAQRGGLGGMGGPLRGNYMLWEAHGAREISNGATWLRSIALVGTPTKPATAVNVRTEQTRG